MGTCRSKAIKIEGFASDKELIAFQARLDESFLIPMEVQVAHFTPSTFPLCPSINNKTAHICNETWRKITSMDEKDGAGGSMSGITVFYNNFYNRIDQVDTSGKMVSVFASNGHNSVGAKGSILLRIVEFLLTIDGDNAASQTRLYLLGRSHRHKGIRPWMYSLLLETLLLTIAERLGTEASLEVMSSWVNLVAFVFRSMMPQALQGTTIPDEMHINTSSVFEGGKTADEVHEIEEMRQLRRRLGNKSSDAGSNVTGSIATKAL